MVDLVKIRKKAKEKAAAVAVAVSEAAAEVVNRATRSAEAAAAEVTPARSDVATGAETRTPAVVTPAPAARKKSKTTEPAPKAAGEDAGAAQPPAPPSAPQARPERDNQQLTAKLKRFLETAGERRVENARETEGTAEAQLELLTFSIAGEMYAIGIENVVEIVTPRAVTRIPNSDPLVVGILSLRGMIVTLVDARQRLGHPGAVAPTADTRIIVVQFDHEVLGFSVDRVLRVIKIDAQAVQPHPVVHASEQDDSVRGVFRHADALTILLDLDKLLNTRAAAASA